jgi:hypothetical protein
MCLKNVMLDSVSEIVGREPLLRLDICLGGTPG